MSVVRCAARAVLLAATITSGCSSTARQGREQEVIEIQKNIGVGQRANVNEIVDVGLARCHNITSQPMRILSIRLVRKPAAVHLVGVHAFNAVTMGGFVFTTVGDMTKGVPQAI